MIGMNVIFHIVAAGIIVGLVYLWLKAQRQRDLFRDLTRAAAGEVGSARFRLGTPVEIMTEICGLLAIPFEKLSNSKLLPQRVELRPLGELLLSQRPSLLRWKDNSSNAPVLEVVADEAVALVWQRHLDQAFAGQIQVLVELK